MAYVQSKKLRGCKVTWGGLVFQVDQNGVFEMPDALAKDMTTTVGFEYHLTNKKPESETAGEQAEQVQKLDSMLEQRTTEMLEQLRAAQTENHGLKFQVEQLTAQLAQREATITALKKDADRVPELERELASRNEQVQQLMQKPAPAAGKGKK